MMRTRNKKIIIKINRKRMILAFALLLELSMQNHTLEMIYNYGKIVLPKEQTKISLEEAGAIVLELFEGPNIKICQSHEFDNPHDDINI